VIIPGTFFPAFFQPGTLTYFVGETAISLFLLCIPLSIGIAILRFRLWDIDLVINRALVYGLLTACVLGMYVLVVGYLGALFRAGGNLFISLLATGLVAVFFQPLRERLQRGVNRLMYGERDEPYAVVTRLSQRLEGTLAPESVLPTIVETVAQALKLPYAAILLQQDDTFAVVASYGKPIDNPLVLSLTYQGETIGQLLLAARTPGDAFTAGDRRLLDELARHAGLAAHAVQLTADLQRSRERLVTAREEERRRLRRDLHDGLGSVLTSVMFKLDASDELFDRDPVTARALLAEVRAQTQASIDDIRRLVYNLRPPILDEWGLVAALREHVAQYNFNTVQVSIDATSSFSPLPAAIEVAVYRVVLEALANVIKHAQATTCTIRLDLMDDALTVEVQDDGVGRPAGCHSGVGTAAMSERAEELGGLCVVEEAVPHGTRVFARFPVRKE
jgi:signal transduction histidine kinase